MDAARPKIHWSFPTFFLSILLLLWLNAQFPVGSTVESSRYTQCQSNLKQLAVLADIYSADSNDRLPLRHWHDALFSYAKQESIFSCPKIWMSCQVGGYAFNDALVGKPMPKDPLAEKTVIFFETGQLGYDQTLPPSLLLPEGRDGLDRCVSYAGLNYKRIPPGEKP